MSCATLTSSGMSMGSSTDRATRLSERLSLSARPSSGIPAVSVLEIQNYTDCALPNLKRKLVRRPAHCRPYSLRRD